LELRRTADFCEYGESVRIPLDHHFSLLYLIAVIDFQLRAINYRVALAFAVLLVDHGDRALAVHHHQISGLRLNRLQSDEAHRAVVLGIQPRLLRHPRSRASNVECTHGELRSGLADRLRRDDAGGFAELDEA